jgi:hypothetical protein
MRRAGNERLMGDAGSGMGTSEDVKVPQKKATRCRVAILACGIPHAVWRVLRDAVYAPQPNSRRALSVDTWTQDSAML